MEISRQTLVMVGACVGLFGGGCARDTAVVDPGGAESRVDTFRVGAPEGVWSRFASIDLDRDGVGDFFFESRVYYTTDVPSSGGSMFLSLRPREGCELLYTQRPNRHHRVDTGTVIGLETPGWWYPSPADLAALDWSRDRGWDSLWRGPWAGIVDGLLPVAIDRAGSLHYGRVRMSVDRSTGRPDVTEIGWQPIAGASIIAGVHP